MKISLSFLLLGISLALTNAFILNNNKNKNKNKMGEKEAFSHGRAVTLVMKRWNDWQNCHRCSEIERYCMEKAIVEDIIFILRLLANDMGQSVKDLVGTVDFKIQIQYVYNAVDNGNCDSLTQVLRSYGLLNHFVQTVIALMNKPLKDSNVDLGSICKGVNDALGGILGSVLDIVENLTGVVTGLVGTATGVVGDVLGSATGALGGVVGSATGVAGNLLGTATGLLGGLKLG
ncbi:uncharacterized protein LOC130367057 [Hyla sarda]|uniref:uncharacterized protein LOC130367057 n=1 Tax=Hyla sarda TaxID=327740 RepID=UPI0024C2CA51|nr:uncharacterized protein LOC130367057 [Hyla sarda]